jgi:hypothetical protein
MNTQPKHQGIPTDVIPHEDVFTLPVDQQKVLYQVPPPPRVYMGVIIHRTEINASGMRWYALTDNEGMRADTLAGIKRLIKASGTNPVDNLTNAD